MYACGSNNLGQCGINHTVEYVRKFMICSIIGGVGGVGGVGVGGRRKGAGEGTNCL